MPESDELGLASLSVSRTFCGFDVAVDDRPRAWASASAGGVGADAGDVTVGEHPRAAQPPQGVALDQLGDEEGARALVGELVERCDIGMSEAGAGLGLAQHTPAAVGRLDHLDRHGPLQFLVPAAVNGAESAAFRGARRW